MAGTMRALVVDRLAPDYQGVAVREIARPEPGPSEVRVRVRAAAVNFPDLMQTRGEHQHKPDLPFIGGLEMAGEVDAVGPGVTAFRPGDAVCSGGRGVFAEYVVLPAAILQPKPARLSYGEAAGYPVAYLTAYVALVRAADARPGEWVLVHGAAGGVGLAAVDLARAMGCKVIAASASDEKLAVIGREYAPDALVNVTEGFRERVKALTGGRGADVIYDPVGGDIFDESVRCIAFGGRILSIGFTSGRLPTLPVNIALIKGFSVHGVRAGEYGRQFPEKGRENTAAIWRLAEEGRVKPRVHAEYPLDRWREAYETLAQRKVVGKTIIRPDL
ncbi:NADPH:quinone oxidoreductase family protein [Phenylobacterium sp.]|uniref:NADPH:quinone oxidoreductase family protein n=1 Tax=Phenylobacterium sp. TaxID=1871053 RepID=UPI00301D2FC2